MSENFLKVTHVVFHLQMGGLERVVLNLLREGQRCGQQVSVICLQDRGKLADEAEALGVTVRCLHKPPGMRLNFIPAITRELRDLGTEVVHTHQIGALFYAGPAARMFGSPVIVHTEHGKHYDGRPGARWRGRIAALTVQRYICVSRDIAQSVLSYRITSAAKVAVVANGIDSSKFSRQFDRTALRDELGIPASAPVIGTVANLRRVKRQDVLIQGFSQLRASADRILPHLLLVGDGYLRDELGRLAVTLGVGDRVHFVGAQAEPERFLQLMDLFALTSESEGMPLSLLEAWAAGVPVVASRVGGIPELVEEGRTGLLFAAGDVADLTAQLATLLERPALAREVGLAGQARVRAEFDIAAMGRAYRRHYDELLTPRRRCALPEPAAQRL